MIAFITFLEINYIPTRMFDTFLFSQNMFLILLKLWAEKVHTVSIINVFGTIMKTIFKNIILIELNVYRNLKQIYDILQSFFYCFALVLCFCLLYFF